MPFQIVFSASEKCERELLKKGFSKKEVWIKDFNGKAINSTKACEEGDSDLMAMENKPNQFITTSWWGACFD